jgi:hypothetical protein
MIPLLPTNSQFLKAAQRKRPQLKVPLNSTAYPDDRGLSGRTVLAIGKYKAEEIYVSIEQALAEIP